MDATCPIGVWPGVDWHLAAEVPAADRMAALDAAAFPDVDRADPDRRGIRTDGLVVVHRGALVYERYAAGWTGLRRHLAWSATKSVTNALTGIAVRDGLLSVDASICTAGFSAAIAPSCAVTVDDLLTFSSGWDWHETYEGASPTSSSVLAMLYGEGRGDMAAFVTGHPLRAEPGATWMYSSGDTVVLSAVVGHALAPAFGDRWPWVVLFDPLGMDPVLERDGVGTYVGSSYLWATPRDLARFGLLLLRDGCWDGQRLLPEGWVAWSTTPSDAMRGVTIGRDPGDVQGRQFWLNRPVPEAGQVDLPWPSVPEGAFAARGHWGQSVTVIPSLDLVVVRTADDREPVDLDPILAAAIGLVTP
ncbi:MAG: serine hydrolase [Myxococcota bacterium]